MQILSEVLPSCISCQTKLANGFNEVHYQIEKTAKVKNKSQTQSTVYVVDVIVLYEIGSSTKHSSGLPSCVSV